MHRFYLPDFKRPILNAGESHHAIHVLRIKPGAIVEVFDGQGHKAQCRVVEAGKGSVRLAILQQSSTPSLPCRITLAQAIPKKNMDFIVEKATELGAARIVPLLSERTIKRPTGAPERWLEVALEACKQSGNNFLPQIPAPQKMGEFLHTLDNFDLKVIGSLQPDAKPLKEILSDTLPLQRSQALTVLLLIGPEGDFTPAELSLAKSAGCLSLSLGPLILRAETAALYSLSVLRYELQLS
jgi:16S rRNA (uracil1498-N3)-methyltransferase